MNSRRALSIAFVGLMAPWPLQTKGDAQAQQQPIVQIPQSGVPEIITMEGKFVRAAYNNEGYVILGYQASNRSIGEDWMLLEVGMTVLGKTPDYRLKRDDLSLETPDGKTIPLPTVTEQREGNGRRFSNERRSSAIRSTTFRRARAGRAACCSFPIWGLVRCRTTRSISAGPRLSRSSLFQNPWRHRIRPALAEREIREEPRASALPDPDQGRREVLVEELQEHREAGQRRIQDEEVTAGTGYRKRNIAAATRVGTAAPRNR